MNFSIGKTILLLIGIGLSLAILNFILVSKVNKTAETQKNAFEELFAYTPMKFSQLDIDEHGEYRIQTNFIKASTESKRQSHDVVMVTHCTANHLHYLLNMIEHWQGHIHVAVLVPGLDIATSYKAIIGLHLCNSKIKERVTFHLVYTLSHPPFIENLTAYVKQARTTLPKSCNEFLVGITSLSTGKSNYANVQIPYPNNLLRNLARRTIQSDYFFMVDIDMMCSSDLYPNFLKFAEENQLFKDTKDNNMVYVVPAFESQNEIPVETRKENLIHLWESGAIQPFYYKACKKCQHPTNYEKWKRHQSKSNKLNISYIVTWIDPWEPFYIGPKQVPLYDERFKKYGFNRISQVCETHIAGYTFAVLDDAFLVHRGFKEKFHKEKDEENNDNRDLFRKFKRELKIKYPDSTRRC